MSEAGEESGDRLRRTERSNAGIPPERYGDWEQTAGQANTQPTSKQGKAAQDQKFNNGSSPESIGQMSKVSLRSKTNHRSNTSHISRVSDTSKVSAYRVAVLKEKLKVAEEIAALDAKEKAKAKELLQLKLSIREEELKEEFQICEDEEGGSRRSNHSLSNVGDGLQGLTLESPAPMHRVAQWLQSSGGQDQSRRSPFPVPQSDPAVSQLAQALLAAVQTVAAAPTQARTEEQTTRMMARQSLGKDLPNFSGDPEEWPGFITQFRRSTRLCGFSEDENLCRLQRCLKGAAKECVKSMLVLPDNVEVAINVLEEKYGRPELIIETIVQKARKATSPSIDKGESIVDFSIVIRNLVSTVETLQRPEYLINPQLLTELTQKLPAVLRMSWGKKVAKKYPAIATLKDFSNWIEGEARAASFVTKINFPTDDGKGKSEVKRNDKGTRKHTLFVATTSNTDPVSTEPNEAKCACCAGKSHSIEVCRKFKSKAIDDRWTLVREKKLCFGCLKEMHHSSQCKKKKECGVDGCKRNHNPLLHSKQVSQQSVPESSTEYSAETVTLTENMDLVSQIQVESTQILLKVLPVVLKGPKCEVSTFAMLDQGSTATLMDGGLAAELGLSGPIRPLRIKWYDSSTKVDYESRNVKVKVRGAGMTDSFVISNVRTVSKFDLPTRTLNIRSLSDMHHLQVLDLEAVKRAKPKLLIGQDQSHLIESRELREGPEGSPMASLTKLGWLVHGTHTISRGEECQFICHVYSNKERDEDLHQLVLDSFKTESFGVKVTDEKSRSREDLRAKSIMEKTTRRKGDRFETGLLWRDENSVLPESMSNALRRLKSIEKKMDRNPAFAQAYESKIQEYIKKGFACKVTDEELQVVSAKEWYLPHFAVTNPNKPGKLRWICDAAAKSHGVSLNDMLLQGPDYLNSLPGILWKFRRKRVAICADITDMFHRVFIRDEDLPAQRFLWRGKDRNREPDVMVMKVMIFGATSSPSSAQFVKNINALEFKDSYPKAVAAIINHHYMDDWLDSDDTVKGAIKMIEEVRTIHQRGFIICKFVSNSQDVMDSIPKELRANSTKELNLTQGDNFERALGLNWNPRSDEFTFRLKFPKVDDKLLVGQRRPTKRDVLRLVMSLFDPLGFLLPFIVKAKILVQDIWRTGIGWDDELQEDEWHKWNNWLQNLKGITEVKVSRCYSLSIPIADSIQLHVFCDASQQAFCSVAYLRVVARGQVDVAFITAKSRVAPIKTLSIPRLELQAGVLGSRLASSLRGELELDIAETIFWTDSMTVMHWLRNDTRRFKPFVSHRLGEIHELTDGDKWRWLPTELNVADDATRDSKDHDLSPKSRWFNGPKFLKNEPLFWPKQPEMTIKEETELVGFMDEVICLTMTHNDGLLDPNQFSSWNRFIRVMARVLRFITQARGKSNYKSSVLTALELKQAELIGLKTAQSDRFPEEIKRMLREKSIPKGSRLSQLSPVLDDDGLIRLKGRIELSPDLEDSTKKPIILDPKHPLTVLLIQEYHNRAGHHGCELVLNELRRKFWILNARSAVRRSWSNCQFCKNSRIMPKIPEMAPLPDFRVTRQVRPFMKVGIDYFGPYNVTIGRRTEKKYGVLFTCLSTRAIHLELAGSLTTDSAILALRRMIARRGPPADIYSDNGTNFRGASRELKEALMALNQDLLTSTLASKGVTWHFIPPGSPHMGGCWERLVRSVKIALSTTLKSRSPKEEVLHTLFCEAEHTVNSRPLTFVSMDPDDKVALTPNHFLIGPAGTAPPTGVSEPSDLYLRNQWKLAQALADMFWNRWVKEYLPSLTRRKKWQHRTPEVKIGDIVVICDSTLPRNNWPMGEVVATFPGKDGQTRVADVRTNNGVLRRPVVKLGVLDVHAKETGSPLAGGKNVPAEQQQ